MEEQAVDVMMISEVGNDRAGRRHEQDHSGTVCGHCRCQSTATASLSRGWSSGVAIQVA